MKTLGLVVASLMAFAACDLEGSATSPDAAVARLDASLGDGSAGACNPQVTKHTLLPATHISPNQFGLQVFNSNPPSSGPHCDSWGQYTTFVEPPLPRCNYIHNLEHGAVALLHNCPGGCADVTAGLASVVQAFKGDPDCRPARFVITPDPALTTKVAATAWGWTFTADCLDAPSAKALSDFVDAHYGAGPEDVCSGGQLRP